MSTSDVFWTCYGKGWVDPLYCRCKHRLEPGELMLVDSPNNGYSKTHIIGCVACRPDAEAAAADGRDDHDG